MKRLTLGLVVLTAAPAASAQAAPLEIRPGKLGVKAIGDFRPDRNARVGRAIAVFGKPSLRRGDARACRLRWDDVGLRIDFVDLGGGEDACRYGKAQTFRATGDFVTWRGLRVGARRRAITRRHPGAKPHARSYWLKTATSPYGDGGRYAVVRATVEKGRVVAFSGWIGAAGE